MNSAIKDPPSTILSRWEIHSRFWIWGAILLSALVCAMVSWLHLEQRHALDQALDKLQNIRQARIDLGRGFLHLSLGGCTRIAVRQTRRIGLTAAGNRVV